MKRIAWAPSRYSQRMLHMAQEPPWLAPYTPPSPQEQQQSSGYTPEEDFPKAQAVNGLGVFFSVRHLLRHQRHALHPSWNSHPCTHDETQGPPSTDQVPEILKVFHVSELLVTDFFALMAVAGAPTSDQLEHAVALLDPTGGVVVEERQLQQDSSWSTHDSEYGADVDLSLPKKKKKKKKKRTVQAGGIEDHPRLTRVELRESTGSLILSGSQWHLMHRSSSIHGTLVQEAGPQQWSNIRTAMSAAQRINERPKTSPMPRPWAWLSERYSLKPSAASEGPHFADATAADNHVDAKGSEEPLTMPSFHGQEALEWLNTYHDLFEVKACAGPGGAGMSAALPVLRRSVWICESMLKEFGVEVQRKSHRQGPAVLADDEHLCPPQPRPPPQQHQLQVSSPFGAPLAREEVMSVSTSVPSDAIAVALLALSKRTTKPHGD